EATLDMVASPAARSLVIVGFEDVYKAAAQIPLAREFKPIALEGFDRVLIDDNKSLGIHIDEPELLPKGEGWLMAEFGGEDKSESDARAKEMFEAMRRTEGYVDEKL